MTLVTATLRFTLTATGLTWCWIGDWSPGIAALLSTAFTHTPRLVVPGKALRRQLELALAAYVCLHVFLGIGLGFYAAENGFDKAMHIAGFGALTIIMLGQLDKFRTLNRLNVGAGLTLVTGLTIALGGGAAWEIFEFALDQTGWFSAQRGLNDTMLDLIANTAGALLAVMFYITLRQLSGHTIVREGKNP